MSSSVLSTIESLHTLQELKVNSARSALVKSIAETVKNHCVLEENTDKFVLFAAEFTAAISSALESSDASSPYLAKGIMWMTFHTVRETKLSDLWSSFLPGIGCSNALEEPLFMELVNEIFFENMIKIKYATRREKSIIAPSLTKDEENIIRYACGYVGMKLHARFIRQSGRKAAEFVECIDSMHVVGPASSFLDYTREWVDKVNRGGLFYISDDAYNLFVAIEIAMQVNLTNHIKTSYKMSAAESKSRKAAIVDAVLSNVPLVHSCHRY